MKKLFVLVLLITPVVAMADNESDLKHQDWLLSDHIKQIESVDPILSATMPKSEPVLELPPVPSVPAAPQ